MCVSSGFDDQINISGVCAYRVSNEVSRFGATESIDEKSNTKHLMRYGAYTLFKYDKNWLSKIEKIYREYYNTIQSM